MRRRSRKPRVTGFHRFALLCAAVCALATPLPARGAGAEEVSIVQLAPGTRLRFAARPATAPHRPSRFDAAALQKMAQDAAAAHTLPVDYFVRLIRQESAFDPNSVSAAGAQGIAQFMPGTASERGVKDPFDPAEALPKSAELLDELKRQFGNLGLAAAAYNAGPERVRRWLAGRSALPRETIGYVRVVTGHDAADWAKANDLPIVLGAAMRDRGPRTVRRVDRRSFEAELLAALRTPAGPVATTAAMPPSGVAKTSFRSAEASLCAQCIVQSAY